MKLVVGLGNVGSKYVQTRHNVGFMVLDAVADKYNFEYTQRKFDGVYHKITIAGEKVIFLKPELYMNLSGQVIKKYLDFFRIKQENLLIISDDLALPLGYFKLKQQGGTGGHKGLKDIETSLGSQDYKRLKIGILNDKEISNKNYVLSSFSDNEQEAIREVVLKAVDIISDYLKIDFINLMNKYNSKVAIQHNNKE